MQWLVQIADGMDKKPEGIAPDCLGLVVLWQKLSESLDLRETQTSSGQSRAASYVGASTEMSTKCQGAVFPQSTPLKHFRGFSRSLSGQTAPSTNAPPPHSTGVGSPLKSASARAFTVDGRRE